MPPMNLYQDRVSQDARVGRQHLGMREPCIRPRRLDDLPNRFNHKLGLIRLDRVPALFRDNVPAV